MADDFRVGPVLPAEDIARAKAFYIEKLGLTVAFENEGGILLNAPGNTQLFIYPFGKPTAQNTVAAFQVGDVEAAVGKLRGKGVTFEEYDLPGLKTVNGIVDIDGMKGAFFKDSEGNILSLTQM
jgi:catechol 2,3-dioxygenase-like lactoylglutathione lyase family enzyme